MKLIEYKNANALPIEDNAKKKFMLNGKRKSKGRSREKQ